MRGGVGACVRVPSRSGLSAVSCVLSMSDTRNEGRDARYYESVWAGAGSKFAVADPARQDIMVVHEGMNGIGC